MLISSGLTSFFDELFADLPCEENARAYIISIFSKYKDANFNLSKESISLTFLRARSSHNFLLFQTVGDWLFFINSLYPEHLKHANQSHYYDLGRLSYYACYQMINRQWKSYEQLADSFIPLSEYIHSSFHQKVSLFPIGLLKQSFSEFD